MSKGAAEEEKLKTLTYPGNLVQKQDRNQSKYKFKISSDLCFNSLNPIPWGMKIVLLISALYKFFYYLLYPLDQPLAHSGL